MTEDILRQLEVENVVPLEDDDYRALNEVVGPALEAIVDQRVVTLLECE